MSARSLGWRKLGAAFRALPADKVVAGLNMASMMTPTYAGPMVDGTLVPESVETALT